MSSTEPVTMPTARYSIGKTSKLLGISRNTLRKYTNEGLIHSGMHKQTMKRFYTGLDIVRFWRAQV